jgi:transposase
MPESTLIGTLERVRRGRAGQDCQETKVASEPEALVAFFASIGFAVKRIGLEAGPSSAWLHAGLKRAGFDTVLLEMIEIKPWYAASRPRPDCIS